MTRSGRSGEVKIIIDSMYCKTLDRILGEQYINLHLQRVGDALCSRLYRDVYAMQFADTLRDPCCVGTEKVDGGRVLKPPMVRKFFCSVTVVRSVSELMPLGIVPDKELSSR